MNVANPVRMDEIGTIMHVELFCICKSSAIPPADRPEIAIESNELSFTSFPADIEGLAIAIRLVFDQDEQGDRSLRVRIVDSKYADVVTPAIRKLTVIAAPLRFYTHFSSVIEIERVHFDAPGKFTLLMDIDNGRLESESILSVVQK